MSSESIVQLKAWQIMRIAAEVKRHLESGACTTDHVCFLEIKGSLDHMDHVGSRFGMVKEDFEEDTAMNLY